MTSYRDFNEEGDVEVDATDHSVSDHGRTHGTGCHLVHGNVDEQALGEISGVYHEDFAIISSASERISCK